MTFFERKIHLIGAPSGWGAKIRATEKGPLSIAEVPLKSYLDHPNVHWHKHIYPTKNSEEITIPSGLEPLPIIVDHCQKVAREVSSVIQENGFPCVIGGDHSIAIGTWSGATHALRSWGKFGLIWIDAHMDAHIPETSPSQAIHGMPVASLMGYGLSELKTILDERSKISPENLVLIGVRSFETGEEALLKKLNVKVFTNEDVQQKGFEALFKQAIEIASKGTVGFGMSIDLDGFDPQFAPGVGSPEPDGLDPDEVIPALKILKNNHHFKGMEITEYNPERDKNYMTRKLIQKLIQSIVD